MSLVLFPLAILLLTRAAPASGDLASEYSQFAALDEEAKVKLYWTIDSSDGVIRFAVEAETTGWVGFGISSGQGKMEGADIVIGWVKDGQAYYSDRHGLGEFLPRKDDTNNYELTGSDEKDGKTTLKFKRKLDTCDPQDNAIQEGTTKVIYAYHPSDPASENEIPKHPAGARGARSVMLLSSSKAPGLPSNMSAFDVLNNQTKVPNRGTTYWCKPFKVPEFPGKRQVMMVEPVIQGGHEGLVHHILVYECADDFPEHLLNHEGPCYGGNMPPQISSCAGQSSIASWAIGAGNFYYPEVAGFPLGIEGSPKYVVMETHYDNPELRDDFVDSSGLRFWYSDQLRKYDAGVLQIGARSNYFLSIPPGQTDWKTSTYCPSKCTKEGFKNSELSHGGVNVFAIMLHTHLAGRKTWVRHIRDGVERPNLAQDYNYDFNYQEYQVFPKEVVVMPGDELMDVCVYDTTDRTNITQGGLQTTDEMCLAFLMYYPKLGLGKCSSTDVDGYKNFADQHFKDGIPAKWDDSLTKALRESYDKSANVYIECMKRGKEYLPGLNFTSMPKIKIDKPYKPKPSCESESPTSLSGTVTQGCVSLVLLLSTCAMFL